MTNEERAQRAEAAIAAYPGRVISGILGERHEDLSATIVNLVTDLMHLAAQNGISPDDVAETSQDHYDIEDVAERGFYLGDEMFRAQKTVLNRMIDEQRERERKP